MASSPVIHVANRSGRRTQRGRALPEDPKTAPSAAAVRHIATHALSAAQAGGELSVLLVCDEEIQALNAQWRGNDRPTNVLSFPPAPFPSAAPDRPLGDVVVSLDTVARQGAETGSGYAYTFAFYLVHGILHLLGWDHQTAADSRRMRALTRKILEAAGVT